MQVEQIIRLHETEWVTVRGIKAYGVVARLDEIHPVLSGNKFYKLNYNLAQAKAEKKGIITMGGAYSNHLAATAYACYNAGIPSAALIRGELTEPLNHTLSFCREHHMKLLSVPRKEYKKSSSHIKFLLAEYPQYFFVPEGGDNSHGEKGCSEIASSIPNFDSFTHIACAVGTGTTVRGLAKSLLPHQQLIAIPVLNIKYEEQETFLIKHLSVKNQSQLHILFDYAGKGYASQEPELFEFMNMFYKQTTIPLDFIYTAKLLKAISNLFDQHYFTVSDRLLLIHTGGLQGNLSLQSGTLLY